MNLTRYLPAVFILILLAIINSAAQGGRIEKIDALMNQAHRNGIFNGNVLIAEKGKIIYQRSLGFADGGKTINLNAGYRFNIGSIAKEFNAVGIMILKERGKLKLDDKVSKFLPELPAWAQAITVKNLLQYASGLPDINWKTVKGDADVLRDLKAAEKLNFEPGTTYAYSNSNTFVQRQIIERITGAPFAKFVENEMLKPCAMTASVVDPPRELAKIAVSFNNDGVENARQFDYPMSGWTSVTAADLYRWTQCLHAYKIIDQASVSEILQPFAAGKQAGLGGGSQENGMLKEHYHQGTSADFEALMYSELAPDLTIILLTNNKNFKVFEIKDAIKNILAGKPYKTPKQSVLGVLMKQIDGGADEIIKLYEQTKRERANDFDFDEESALNSVGYTLISRKKHADALKIFALNARLFPNSANVYDSLGETFLAIGDKQNALLNYKKSLQLNPQNQTAKSVIETLESAK